MKTRFLRDRDGKIDKRYVIAEDGSYIRNKETGEKRNIYENKGYNVISITINGKYYHQIKICHLQWLAWKGVIPKGFHIHHIDENKKNDHKDNIDCLSKSEHRKYHMTGNKYMLGRTGEKHPMFGRTGEKSHMFGKTGEKHPMFGKHFSHTEEWKKNHSGEKHPMFGVHRFGEENPNVKITDLQVEKIKFLGYIKHLKMKDIAKKIGTTKSNVNHILQGYRRNPDHLSKQELIQQTKKRYKKSLLS